MRLEFIQKIIEQIQQQMHCPKCKSAFQKEHIEIIHVSGNRVEFASLCHVCKAKSQIVAELGKAPAGVSPKAPTPPTSPAPQKRTSRMPLTRERVDAIKNRLQTFRGKHVKELFEGNQLF